VRLSDSYEQCCITDRGARLRKFGIDVEEGRWVRGPK
jgi:hypothetical protein